MDLLVQGKGPQAEVPWRCKHDGWVNACGDSHCTYRGNINRPAQAGRHPCRQERQQAALATGTPFNAWDWICNSCQDNFHILYANHAIRKKCHKCGIQKAWLEKGFVVNIRKDFAQGTTFDSDWQ